MLVFDMTDPSQIPVIAEQLFMALDAEVEFRGRPAFINAARMRLAAHDLNLPSRFRNLK